MCHNEAMTIAEAPKRVLTRLEEERNIWMATTRPDGRPHLTPIWFIWHNSLIYICVKPTSVKARNLAKNPATALSLEDGSDVVICEGTAELMPAPWSAELKAKFKAKYDWDIDTDKEYGHVLAITPKKWLSWSPD